MCPSRASGRAETARALLLTLCAGCGDQARPPPPCPSVCDAGPSCPETYTPPPSTGDADGDGTPDDMDGDADGDGVPNDFENLGGFRCVGPDPDGDGLDNWLDPDADNDGIRDGAEVAGGSDPYAADTDRDGFTDLIERAAGTSLTDADIHPPSGSRAIAVPYMGGEVRATVVIENRIENADVFFLVDTTGSMSEERNTLIDAMQDVIVPALADAFDDVYFGVGGVDDYPIGEYGSAPDPDNINSSGDFPFYLVTDMIDGFEDRRTGTAPRNTCYVGVGTLEDGSNGFVDVVEALRGLGCHTGGDLPEAYLPALWAVATGSGLAWAGGEIAPQTSCAPGRIGFPCFREEAIPIVLLVGDAAFHNGPDDSNPYAFTAPTYVEAVDALNAIGAKVVSIYSGGDVTPRLDYERLAMDTGSVRGDGTPFVFHVDSDGTGLDTTVVDAMTELAGGVPQDISAQPHNDETNPIDATGLITGITTGECTRTDGTPGGYAMKDDMAFFTVEGGAACEFIVALRNDTVEPTDEPQVFVVTIRAIGSGGSAFSARTLFIVVTRDGDSLVL